MNITTKKTTVFNTDKELSDFLLGNLADSLKNAIKVVVKSMIRHEMEELRKNIDDKLSFNGNYFRQMLTGIGKIEDVPVPRFREGAAVGRLKSLAIFDEEKNKFLKLVAEMHRLGISGRKIDRLCKDVLGVPFSKNRVSRIHQELAQEESLKINSQKIDDDFEYLLLDGMWTKVKTFGLSDNNKKVMLCALGVKITGERKILGFMIMDKENYESWSKFIMSLKERGLSSKALKLIIADDNGGLTKALNHLMPGKDLQICMAHKVRNVISKTSHSNKKEIATDLQKIYASSCKDEAVKRMRSVAKKWYLKEPKAIESLRYDFEKTLTYLKFPQEIWVKIRTTNLLERTFREVRRRISVFDNSFNSEESLERYGNTIFDYLNNNYPAHLHTKS